MTIPTIREVLREYEAAIKRSNTEMITVAVDVEAGEKTGRTGFNNRFEMDGRGFAGSISVGKKGPAEPGGPTTTQTGQFG